MHPPPDRMPADFPTDLSTSCWLEVVLATPGLRPLHYFLPHAPENTTLPIVGSWVLAPLGRRTLLGLVTAIHTQDPGEVAVDRLRPVQSLLSTLPLVSPATLAFYRFTASYYRRPLGAVLASAVPPYLRLARHHLPTTRASLATRLAQK
ncbi:MAG: hypothetical protein RL258_935, partial [Pseudomonadota bacterium]